MTRAMMFWAGGLSLLAWGVSTTIIGILFGIGAPSLVVGDVSQP